MRFRLARPALSWSFGCSLLLIASLAGSAGVVPRPALLVANQGDGTLSIVDPVTHTQVAAVPEGVAGVVGHEVAVSPDGRLAYLPLYSDSGVGKPGTNGQVMLVVDLASRKVVNKVDFGHGVRPHCVVYDKVSGLLYVTTELDRSITIVDPKTLRIVGAVSTNQEQSHMLAVSHDGHRGYTANVGAGTISVLDLAARKFVTTIPVSATVQRIAVSNDDTRVYTADQTKPRMAIIDTATNRQTGWLPLPSIGYGSAFTRDGRFLLVTLPAPGELAVVNMKENKVERTIAVGPHPQEVMISPDGTTAYASCLGGHQVTAVDLRTWKVRATINVGEKADGMAWVPAVRQ